MRLFSTLVAVALTVTPVIATAQTAPAKPAFSSASTIGALMANPAAKEIVIKAIPEMAQAGDNPQAAGMTLKDVQQYIPTLDDKKLAALDADLAKVPAPAK